MDKAFTIDEATDIAEDFMDLEDTGIFIETEEMTIACNVQKVVVAPYPEDEKGKFIAALKTGEGADTALSNYKGDEYDVLVTGFDADGISEEMIIIPIRTYTTAYGFTYRYP